MIKKQEKNKSNKEKMEQNKKKVFKTSSSKKNVNEDKKKSPKSRANKIQIWVKKETLIYERELKSLQVELLKFQNHVKNKGLKILMIFEGRDAAGKGGTI